MRMACRAGGGILVRCPPSSILFSSHIYVYAGNLKHKKDSFIWMKEPFLRNTGERGSGLKPR